VFVHFGTSPTACLLTHSDTLLNLSIGSSPPRRSPLSTPRLPWRPNVICCFSLL
jgi:hypothetical protein